MSDLIIANEAEALLELQSAVKSFRVGCLAYSEYVQSNLVKLMNHAVEDESTPLPQGEAIIIARDVDGVARTIGLPKSTVLGFFNGFDSLGEVQIDGHYFTTAALAEGFSEVLDCMSGQVTLYSGLARASLKDTVKDFRATVTSDGQCSSQWLLETLENLPQGESIIQCLSLQSVMEKDATTVEYYQDPGSYRSAYSDTNAFALGMLSIWDDLSSFFEGITFDLFKIGEFFKGMWNGIQNVFSWIINESFGEFRENFEVIDDYQIESIDIPMVSGWVDIENDVTNAYGFAIGESSQRVVYVSSGVDRSDNGSYAIHIFEEFSSIGEFRAKLYKLYNSVIQGGSIIICLGGCFALVSCDPINKPGQLYFAFYLAGAIETRSQGGESIGMYVDDGETKTLTFYGSDSAKLRDYAPLTLTDSKNESIQHWLLSAFERKTIRSSSFNPRDPMGNIHFGRTPSTTDGLDLTQRPIPSVVSGADVIRVFDGIFPHPERTLISWAMLTACYFDLTNSTGNLKVRVFNGATGDDVATAALSGDSTFFLPYVHCSTLSTMVHAQTDSERGAEAKKAIISVLVAAAVAVVATKAIKLIKKMRVKARDLAINRDAAYQRLLNTPANMPETRQARLDEYLKAANAQKWHKKLTKLIYNTPKTIVDELKDGLTMDGPLGNFKTSSGNFLELKAIISGRV